MDKPSLSWRPACFGWVTIAIASVALMAFGCSDETAAPPTPVAPHAYFPIRVGETTLQLQLALTPAEQQRGLMERQSLPPGHGMLFAFPTSEKRSFWMLNTPLPLDLAYADNSGTIREIHPLIPFNLNSVESHSNAIAIAIEVERGELRRQSIGVGTTINLDDLRSAIRRRGYNPSQFALAD